MTRAVIGYSVDITPLAEADGGGFLATFPDLPGCVSDGDTEEEALANAQDALACYLESFLAPDRPLPQPNARSVIDA